MNSSNFLLRKLCLYFFEKYKLSFAVLLILMFISSIAEVISIGSVMPFLAALASPDTLTNFRIVSVVLELFGLSSTNNLLLILTIIFCLASFFAGAMRLLLLWYRTQLSFKIGSDLSSSMYFKTLHQPYIVHLERNSSYVIGVIVNKSTHVIAVIMQFLNLVNSLMMLPVILLGMIYFDPSMTIKTIFCLAISYYIIYLLTHKRLVQNSDKTARGVTQVYQLLQEGLGGIRDVLINGTQKYFFNTYKKVDLSWRRAESEVVFIADSSRYITESVGMIIIAVIAFYLSSDSGKVEAGLGAIPSLGVLALGAQRAFPLVQQAFKAVAVIKGSQNELRDCIELLEQKIPAEKVMVVNGQQEFRREIELKNISFAYQKNSQYVLKDINLKIEKGDRVGILGETGSGKSTLLDVFMGLLEPTSGELVVDGVKISAELMPRWQKQIAHVPQSIFLADTTIAENIAFGVPVEEIDMAKVISSARLAFVHEVIEAMSEGYFSRIGEHGSKLSGGQRQRIGIARALYKEPSIIIFDEATSALDGETEKLVMSSINALDSEITVVLVAHRLSTLAGCNKVVKMNQGRMAHL